jgi:hypothetical protein
MARALVVGAGGLGSPAAMYLAAAGVGTLVLADHDTVDLTNLQRQIMHSADMVGMPKVASARATLHRLNPQTRLEPIQARLEGEALDAEVARSRRGARLHRQLRHPPRHQPRLREAPQAAGVRRRDPLRRPGLGVRPAPSPTAAATTACSRKARMSRRCAAR